jgi:hypothetical protein
MIMQTFKDMLATVVFANNRPGYRLIALEQFLLKSAKDGPKLDPIIWSQTIKAGDHITQSMLLTDIPVKIDTCQYPDCSGSLAGLPLIDGGYQW